MLGFGLGFRLVPRASCTARGISGGDEPSAEHSCYFETLVFNNQTLEVALERAKDRENACFAFTSKLVSLQ